MLYVITFGRGRYACPKGTIYQDLFIYIKIYIYTSRHIYILQDLLISIHQNLLICIKMYLYKSKFIYIYIYQDLVKSN